MNYILIEKSNLDATIKAQLSNRAFNKNGKFQNDSEQTLRTVVLAGDTTEYYILKWNGEKPTNTPSKYDDSKEDPKQGKIFKSAEDIIDFLNKNENTSKDTKPKNP